MPKKRTKPRRILRVCLWRIKRDIWSYIGWVAFIIFLTIVAGAIAAHLLVKGAFSTLGEFGDFVGGISNPMLALLGLLALLYTIRLQAGELALSRLELALTRQELDRSATALEHQSAHLERQQLSQSFFDLFGMYKSVVAEMTRGSKESRVEGKAALARYFNIINPASFYNPEPWSLETAQKGHERVNSELGNYFRIIFRIFLFLQDHGEEADLYADMFRAQLTTPELHLLFINCCSEVGSPMERFAVRFELFDNMPIPNGENFKTIAQTLDPKSFGKNAALLNLVQATQAN